MDTILQFQAIQKNPKLAQGALQDPRMIEVMGVLMGIDLQAFERPEGSGDSGPSQSNQAPSSTPPEPSASSSAAPQSSSSAKIEEDVPMEEPEPEEDTPEAIEEKKDKAAAEEQKKIGNDAYRKRDFDAAGAAFEKAWELWPKDTTFLTNLSGM